MEQVGSVDERLDGNFEEEYVGTVDGK